jgi:uncharacterized coiled-coil protein SlyX
MDQRIEQLEFKISFLEEATAQLSDVVYEQRQQIEALRAQLAGFMSRVEAAQSQAATTYTAEEEKPPHY